MSFQKCKRDSYLQNRTTRIVGNFPSDTGTPFSIVKSGPFFGSSLIKKNFLSGTSMAADPSVYGLLRTLRLNDPCPTAHSSTCYWKALCVAPQDYRQTVSVTISATKSSGKRHNATPSAQSCDKAPSAVSSTPSLANAFSSHKKLFEEVVLKLGRVGLYL